MPQAIPVLYNEAAVKYRGDNNVESRECASGASGGARPDAVKGRDVRPSNFRDRVFERYESIPQVRPTDPNRVGSFTSQNGAGAASAMGKGEGASGETKADDFSSRQKEDRGGTKGEVGEDEGRAEEGLACVSLCGKNIQSALGGPAKVARRLHIAARLCDAGPSDCCAKMR